MTDSDTARLRECVARYGQAIPRLAAIGELLNSDSPGDPIGLYERCYPLLEQALWGDPPDFDGLLDCYQSLFREQEALLERRGDDRYHFILSIPVADRPAHLKACLESIHQLCEKFGYGGTRGGVYQRVQVVVAEDSRDPENVRQHRALVEAYRGKGLQVVHFGLMEQYELLHSLPGTLRERLGGILTRLPRERFYRKGQAANRNLSYLKCLQLTGDRARTLYYMVDSDQSFCVNRLTGEGEQSVCGLNYFHAIDKVFRTTDTLMLTGKLVGDPPVSPSVMAANFLDDVTAHFRSMAALDPDEACRFHALPARRPGSAAYHDLAGLFGFENPVDTFPYRCRLHGAHDHWACLRDFCGRLNAFFFGEHLTRRTFFDYGSGLTALAPARTVYPGNYVVNFAGLKYIIPFGELRLRMSGPTAGRLIAAEIGHRFASINMPHLHTRTSGGGPQDDFRPGVELEQAGELQVVDLSDEFERQFFGDLMLFTAEALAQEADVQRPFPEALVREIIGRKEAELLALYEEKHQAVAQKLERLRALVFDEGHWWQGRAVLEPAMAQAEVFITSIRSNFGERSPAWQQIRSAAHRARRREQIVAALIRYRSERDAWDSLFA